MSDLSGIARLLGSVFIVEPMLGSPAKLNRRLREICAKHAVLAELFPLPLSIPSDAPAELPRAFLADPSDAWKVVCSAVRIDLHYAPGNKDVAGKATSAQDFWRLCAQLLPAVQTNLQVEVSRVATVLHQRSEMKEPVAEYISRAWFTPSLPAPLAEDMFECEFHVNTRGTWSTGVKEQVVNKWVRLKARRGRDAPQAAQLLFREFDINTAPDDPAVRFSDEEVRAFFDEVGDMIAPIAEAIDERAGEQPSQLGDGT